MNKTNPWFMLGLLLLTGALWTKLIIDRQHPLPIPECVTVVTKDGVVVQSPHHGCRLPEQK